eukprot:snap_masked-scaffold_4-processed-gene-19.37-mRNA-1 protein AED:1.00 eAED:1.00 QI:0/-1/0/0/-1/1/1/0/488
MKTAKELFLSCKFLYFPETISLHLNEVFNAQNLKSETKQLIELITIQRSRLLKALSEFKEEESWEISKHSAEVNAEMHKKFKCVSFSAESYMSSLWQLQKSLEGAIGVEISFLEKPLMFSYRSNLKYKRINQKKFYDFKVMIIEVIFCLVVYAYAEFNNAVFLLKSITRENLITSSKLFQKVAGIISFLLDTLLTKWVSKPDNTEIPLEFQPASLKLLKNISLEMSQKVSIVFALEKINFECTEGDELDWVESFSLEKTEVASLNLVIKLLAGLEKQSEDEATMYISNYLTFKLFGMKSLHDLNDPSTEDLAETSYSAVQYFFFAMEKLKKYASLMSNNENLELIREELDQVDAVYKQVREDNEKVYFGTDENFAHKLQLKMESRGDAFMAKVVEYQPPKVTILSFASESYVSPASPLKQNSFLDDPPRYEDVQSAPNVSSLLKANGIDEEVFNSMPMNMQDEILQDLRAKGKSKPKGEILTYHGTPL